MSAPVHFDPLTVEAQARATIKDACDAMRTARRAQGKDEGLVNLQESLQEIAVTAAVRLTQARNDGFYPSEIMQCLGFVIGGLISQAHTNFDPDGRHGQVFFGAITQAMAGISGERVKGGMVASQHIAGTQGGTA